jgi:tetratricopeptide (TPR) repeat protein
MEQALLYYEKILNLSPDNLKPITLLKVALYAQRNNKLETAQKILTYLWKNKNRVSRRLQAEILFWLAEGEQLRGNLDMALEKYLKVYWFYKDQYIWSITGLYRAALIYEQKGKLITAKRILEDVVKNAKRKSEKEAATLRLKAIKKITNNSLQSLFLF